MKINVILLGEKIKMNGGCTDDEAKSQDLAQDENIVDTAHASLTAENKKEKKNV